MAETLTRSQAQLLDELAAALEEMVDRTCLDMLPLYFQGVKRVAHRHLPSVGPLEHVDPKLLRMRKKSRSMYATLAAFRHAVIWQSSLERVDSDFARAVEHVYFTPFPANAPPYAWTKKSSQAPDIGQWESPTTLDNFAKEGCWESVQDLRERAASYAVPEGGVRADFIRCGIKKSAKEVLRLEHHWEDESDE